MNYDLQPSFMLEIFEPNYLLFSVISVTKLLFNPLLLEFVNLH